MGYLPANILCMELRSWHGGRKQRVSLFPEEQGSPRFKGFQGSTQVSLAFCATSMPGGRGAALLPLLGETRMWMA